MNKSYQISIIIPFYKRDDYAEKIYKSLDKQSLAHSLLTEVIFVDSCSRINLDKFLQNYVSGKFITYKVVDTKNHVSIKRNYGIKNAISEKIVIIDDDCIPESNFLNTHYLSLENSKNKNVLICGDVKYYDNLIYNSNYFKFRNEKHSRAIKKNSMKKNINFHNVVTMNMAFNKNLLVDNNLYFNETYNTYGFEDLQFAIDAQLKGFLIESNKAKIYHQDSTDLDLYYKKLKSFNNAYINLFYNYNIKYFTSFFLNQDLNMIKIKKDFNSYRMLSISAKINIFIKKNNLLMKPILKTLFIIIKVIRVMLSKYLFLTDEYKFLYSYRIYKILIGISVLECLFENKKINKNWINK